MGVVVERWERPKIRKVASDIDSINTNLEAICNNLERITDSLARLTELAEVVATTLTIPARIINRVAKAATILN